MLSRNEQLKKIVEEAGRLLLVVPGEGNAELAASAAALARVLRAEGKHAAVIRTAGHDLPGYIANAETFLDQMPRGDRTVISIDTRERPLKDLSYERNGDVLRIILTPKKKPPRPTDVKFDSSPPATDAVLLFGVADLSMISDLVEVAPEVFTDSSLVNIDVSPGNEDFGHCNIVDIKAAGTSEVIADFLLESYPKALDEDLASLLLAGIMLATRNFQASNVSSACLRLAGRLLDAGADRDRVTRELYQTKSLSALRLWGRVLARIQTDEKRQMIWSLLNESDFEKSDANEEDLPGVVDELLISSPGVTSACIVYQVESRIRAIITGPKVDQVVEKYKNAVHQHGTYSVINLNVDDPQLGQSELAKHIS